MKINLSKLCLRLSSVFAVLAIFSTLLVPARAAYDYNDYITNIEVDGDMDIVTITAPANSYKIELVCIENGLFQTFYDDTFTWSLESSLNYSIYFTGFYGTGLLDVTNIPDGTLVTYNISCSSEGGLAYNTPNWYTTIYYRDNTSYLGADAVNHGKEAILDNLTFEMTMNKLDGATMASFDVSCRNFQPFYSGDFTFTINSLKLTLSISSLYRLQEQTGKTNAILKEVELQLAEQGKTLDDILNQQEQTNDKLDKLPSQIGDEMQGVIDNEKAESESEGNKFVDQILDALPDPSADVLVAMKSLTDSMAYTGTDAVLPIPAIVLPGIDGLFPETEIWGGTDFDLGEYINLLPPALLTLVQSLFTIAIVLFCVYELKGIISYCLTLRENKGG